MVRKRKTVHPDEPLLHPDHPKPVTRREFISTGMMTGPVTAMSGGLFSLFANPREAAAALSSDLQPLRGNCGLELAGAGKVPFVCFDLAGGANMAGSNVLVGGPDGQFDFLSTAGYSKLGLPGDMTPASVNPDTGTNDFINTDLGLAFHSDSAFLRGILEKASPATIANTNGAIIVARSENDTGNNPHNPMYAISRTGVRGELLDLIGSRSSESGGNSMAPASMIDVAKRPTKVDRPSDVTGLVDTGKLVGLLSQDDAVAVLESVYRLSDQKLGQVDTRIDADAVLKDLVGCGYLKSADLADRFGDPSQLNPSLDANLVGPTGIFTQGEYDNDREFQKTASVMKLVANGYAGAGTITMGGYDYHGGRRARGEIRDLRAGRCMGAALEYAARQGVPLCIYVFSDGSLASNGAIDDTVDGRGKGEWTGDNQSTAASFFLVYNPNGRPNIFSGDNIPAARHQQIGYFRPDASGETGSSPVANNVNLLVEAVALNYLALHGEQGNFETLFPNHGLGNAQLRDSLTAFDPIV
ncbi:MAG: hypothetical protein AAF290_07890 [Pseudomonadota bacterium]